VSKNHFLFSEEDFMQMFCKCLTNIFAPLTKVKLEGIKNNCEQKIPNLHSLFPFISLFNSIHTFFNLHIPFAASHGQK